MDGSTIFQLAHVYRRQIQKYGESKFSKFTIYGGEPLLYPEKIMELVEKFRNISRDLPIHVFTNGDLLTDDLLLWLMANDVHINYSLNDDPIELARERLMKIKQYNSVAFMVVVLCPHNMVRLKEILKFSLENHIGLRLMHDFVNVSEESLSVGERLIPEAIRWIIDEGCVFDPELFFNLYSLKNRRKFHAVCGSHLFTVDPDGSVLPCQSIDQTVGNIWDPGFDFLKVKCHMVWDNEEVKECRICEYKLICGGGCPLRKMKYYGRTDVVSPSCKIDKQVIPMMLEMKKRIECSEK
jgi:radical SAM protein with 4Fe4S-binding SPASM domain